MKTKKFFQRNWVDLLFFLVLVLSLPLFFYKLGQTSLISWDEAWYGAIAKAMIKSGDYLHLMFNDAPFADHPPGGIWPIAIAYKIFGVSEFSTRLPSTLAGLGSLVLIYQLGKKLFNPLVGFLSALALCSSPWFLLRSRQGDLDTPLVCFFLLTLYLAFLTSEKKKYFLAFSLSFGYLTSIKSALPFAIIPSLAVIFWGSKLYKLRDFFWPILAAISFFGVWLALLYQTDPSLVHWHFYHSGRNASLLANNYYQSLKTYKDYLHNGIGRWFWPGILGIFGGLLFRQKRFLVLAVFFSSYSLPLLTSPEIQIWHLIPLYPMMILACFGFGWEIWNLIFQKIDGPKLVDKKYQPLVLAAPILLFGLFYGFIQIQQIWYQIIDIPAYRSDEAILSAEASKRSFTLTIDSDFIPAAVFYSDKHVVQYSLPSLQHFFDTPGNNMIITYQWRLDNSKIPPTAYEILAHDRDKILVLKK